MTSWQRHTGWGRAHYKLLDTEEIITYLMGAIQFNKKPQL